MSPLTPGSATRPLAPNGLRHAQTVSLPLGESRGKWSPGTKVGMDRTKNSRGEGGDRETKETGRQESGLSGSERDPPRAL